MQQREMEMEREGEREKAIGKTQQGNSHWTVN